MIDEITTDEITTGDEYEEGVVTGLARLVGNIRGPVGEVLRRHGRQFVSRAPTREQIEYLRAFRDRQMERKKCWANAQRTVMWDHGGRLEYCDGVVSTSRGQGIGHGWMLLDGEVLVDPTFLSDGSPRRSRGRVSGGIIGVIPEGWEYWGVVIARQDVLNAISERCEFGPLLDLFSIDDQ